MTTDLEKIAALLTDEEATAYRRACAVLERTASIFARMPRSRLSPRYRAARAIVRRHHQAARDAASRLLDKISCPGGSCHDGDSL